MYLPGKKLAQQILKLFLKWQVFLLKAIFIFKIQMNGLIFKFYELLKKTGLSFAEKQF
jgi:hypothetical protein